MNNKEASNLISRNKSVFKHDAEMTEALDLAIKALEDARLTGKECELFKRAFFNSVEIANHIEKLKQEAENE